MLSEPLSRLTQKGIAQGKKLRWIFVYLWALLRLFAIYKSLILNEQNLTALS